MSATRIFISILGVVLGILTIRHVYSVGRTLNDHFVAAVVLGCMGFYLFLGLVAPEGARIWMMGGMIGLWGLFAAIDQPGGRAPPPAIRFLMGWPSQTAYAFALWGGLMWILRAPLAWFLDRPMLWPGDALVFPLGLAGLGTLHARLRGLRVNRHAVDGLPLRIVQLSDLHASPLMHREELDRLVERTNALEPDVVFITGDLVMPFSEAHHPYLIEALSKLDAPTYACPGNHDLPILEQLSAELSRIGIPLLVDQSLVISPREGIRIEIVGVNFYWTRLHERMRDAIPPADADATYRILLAHDPRVADAIPRGRFDLILSGHTHGGQVGLNMIGLRWTLLGCLGVRDQGWFSSRGARHYVHCGNWWIGLPPRMGVAGEIAVFEGRTR